EPMVAAQIHFARSRLPAALEDPATMLHEFERCAARFLDIGDERQTCLQRGNAGYAKIELGLYREAEEDLQAALEVAERMALHLAASGARQNLGVARASQGALAAGEALLRKALAWFEE